MKPVGEILIQIGGNAKPLGAALDRAKGELKGFGASVGSMAPMLARGAAIGAASIAATAGALAAITHNAMQNIDVLSKQARAVGMSVASFQVMGQVAEEAGVETDALSKILIKMLDSIDGLEKGSKVAVSAFSAIGLSAADLRGLSTEDQFAKIAERISGIQDPAAKTAAALDVFGKSGAVALNMMDGYAGAAADAAEFQRQFGMAVSDTDAQQIEAANDAMGRMWQALDGVGNILAAKAAPGIEGFAKGVTGLIEATLGANAQLERMFGTLDRAKAILGDEVYNKMMQTGGAVEDNAAKIEALAYNWQEFDQIVSQVAANVNAATSVMVNQGGEATNLALDIEKIVLEMRSLSEEFANGEITAEDFERRMGEATATATTLLEEASSIDGVDMSGAVAAVERLAQALAVAAGVAANLRKQLPGGGTDFTALPDDRGAAIAEAGATQGGFIGDGITTSPRPRAAPNNIDFGLPEISVGDAGGAGGGANKYAQRMEAIVNSLKTEREVIEEWYQESLELLQSASDAELEVLGGKHAALERLEAEHQERLAGIQGAGAEGRLGQAASFFSELADATQAGHGVLGRIHKAAQIAEAIASAKASAIAAWEHGMKTGGPGLAAAYAALSVAKTAIMVSNLAGGGGGGGGGAGAGGAAAVAAPAAPSPATVNIRWIGDMSAGSLGSLTKQLNEELKMGYRLNLVVD